MARTPGTPQATEATDGVLGRELSSRREPPSDRELHMAAHQALASLSAAALHAVPREIRERLVRSRKFASYAYSSARHRNDRPNQTIYFSIPVDLADGLGTGPHYLISMKNNAYIELIEEFPHNPTDIEASRVVFPGDSTAQFMASPGQIDRVGDAHDSDLELENPIEAASDIEKRGAAMVRLLKQSEALQQEAGVVARAMKDDGATWAEIGQFLGISPQAAYQRFSVAGNAKHRDRRMQRERGKR